MNYEEIAAELVLLAESWKNRGMPKPAATMQSGRVVCDVPGCNSLAFVDLKREMGRTRLCLKHFEAVQAIAKDETPAR